MCMCVCIICMSVSVCMCVYIVYVCVCLNVCVCSRLASFPVPPQLFNVSRRKACVEKIREPGDEASPRPRVFHLRTCVFVCFNHEISAYFPTLFDYSVHHSIE